VQSHLDLKPDRKKWPIADLSIAVRHGTAISFNIIVHLALVEDQRSMRKGKGYPRLTNSFRRNFSQQSGSFLNRRSFCKLATGTGLSTCLGTRSWMGRLHAADNSRCFTDMTKTAGIQFVHA
jgi:hypothetical protein